MLCASSAGRLQLLDLQHQDHPHMRTLPLMPPARPVHLAAHPCRPMLLVACQASDKLWELRCMSPVTGDLSIICDAFMIASHFTMSCCMQYTLNPDCTRHSPDTRQVFAC